jgi:hypothetical protein
VPAVLWLGVAGIWSALAPDDSKSFVPTSSYAERSIEGWTVHVNKRLLADESDVGAQALQLMRVKLFDISRLVPARACQELRKVPIWVGVNDGHAPCAEYHPSRDWLSKNGYNPDKAKSVEIGNASRFVEWSVGQPMMLLHELSHAYHDRVLGHAHKGIQAAYEAALRAKLYDSVLRSDGQRERAYALTNVEEYFAEATEAFFGENDFYPFVKAELRLHDPRIYAVLEDVWGVKSQPDRRREP